MAQINTALISVADKTGLIPLAKFLDQAGVKIFSTGGTAQKLRSAKLPVRDVAKVTGFPEIFDGRVKTLHPRIFGGILARRDNKPDQKEMKQKKIIGIDLVVVNLYPFQEIVKRGAELKTALENIDIGGVALLRAAAKNFQDVLVVCDPKNYPLIKKVLKKKDEISIDLRRNLAAQAFVQTADYDAAIARYMSENKYFYWSGKKVADLRYGENPGQKASFFTWRADNGDAFSEPKWLQGKIPSYNNLLDSDAAINLLLEFNEPTAIVVKHTNPCGAASAKNIRLALKKAYAADPLSAFGGIIALNRKCDEKTAQLMKNVFLEVVIAPDFTLGARQIFAKKKNLRLLKISLTNIKKSRKREIRTIDVGVLLQSSDKSRISAKNLKTSTKKKPTKAQITDLIFAWKIAKHIKSNAIALVKNKKTVGLGTGQTSRVESTELAVKRAGDQAQDSVMASDAFFPFPDSVEVAARAGVKAIVHPGGSIRDQEVIKVADQLGIILVESGLRTFRH